MGQSVRYRDELKDYAFKVGGDFHMSFHGSRKQHRGFIDNSGAAEIPANQEVINRRLIKEIMIDTTGNSFIVTLDDKLRCIGTGAATHFENRHYDYNSIERFEFTDTSIAIKVRRINQSIPIHVY